jgi:hypothetical protein
MKHTESQSQQAVIRWFAFACKGLGVSDPRALMAFPLQGARTVQNGARLKAEGMRAGTPDMFLAVKRGGFGGLWVEMKTLSGRLTDSQTEMGCLLLSDGYSVRVCRSADEAIREITAYLRLQDVKEAA